MTISEFIEKIVNVMGGVFEMREYALAAVLIPDEYAERFNGKTEFLLAFDYDVAQENTGSEFVTYGSFIFDTFLEISRHSPEFMHKYVNIGRLEVENAGTKIKKALTLSQTPEIIESDAGYLLFVRFNFSAVYISDEKSEKIIPVCMNLFTGKPDGEMDEVIAGLYSEKGANTNLPHFECADVEETYKAAFAEVLEIAKQNPTIKTDQQAMKVETSRIERYYDELIAENKKRAQRKGLTDERLKEIEEKENSLKLEQTRQRSEITDKFTTKIDAALENAVIYHVPFKRFVCSAGKYAKENVTIYYNFALKKFVCYTRGRKDIPV